jgi:hypothetical protein
MLLNLVMTCFNSILKGQDTILLKTMLIVQMTSFITRHILNMFITNNSLHNNKEMLNVEHKCLLNNVKCEDLCCVDFFELKCITKKIIII